MTTGTFFVNVLRCKLFSRSCLPGYSGAICQDIEGCSPDPCTNGVCLPGGYCQCNPGYFGDRCETENICLIVEDPCPEGEFCSPDSGSPNGYYCVLSPVVINEIMYDALHPDCEDAHGEWIELHNRGSIAVAMTGWYLEKGNGEVADLGSPVSNPGQFYVIGREPNPCFFTAGGLDFFAADMDQLFVLPNLGDTIYLKDESGNIMDQVTYMADSTQPGNSYARTDDGVTFQESLGGTPGAPNSFFLP